MADGAPAALRHPDYILLAGLLAPLADAHGTAIRATVHEASIEGTAFAPGTLRVKVGDRVTWTNRDPFPHTVTSREGRFDSRTIAPGKSWSYRADRKGQFPYLCTLHPTMRGTLIIE